MHDIQWSKQAEKDAIKIKRNGLLHSLADILRTVRKNPFDPSHKFEKITVNKKLTIYTRRINIHHRFVYTIESNVENTLAPNGKPYEGIVYIHRLWGHYP